MAKEKNTSFLSIEELQRILKEDDAQKDAAFNRLKEPFAKHVLSMFVAEHLLANSNDLTPEQIQEVVREGNIARFNAYEIFDEILAVGIPDHFISCHLQPGSDEEDED